MNETTKNFIFSLLVMVITLAVIVALILLAIPLLERRYSNDIVAFIATRMSEEERQGVYSKIATQQQAMWDVVPEPDVARIGQTDIVINHKQAEVRFNNAGMRSSRQYTEKSPDTFRIVCLGDSFVFGTGGREQDRFCDQMEAFYRDHDVTIDGRQIETMALGLGSWTAVQESAYLSSRMTEYDPDLVLMLLTNNDITVSTGVTGKGQLTVGFSPEYRAYGSGTFRLQAGSSLGHRGKNVINADLTPIANTLWEKALASIRHLVNLQQARGKRIAIAVLEEDPNFSALFLHKFNAAGIPAPVFTTNYFRSPETRLPHDGHPNRRGHEILSNHFVNVFHSLGWIPLAQLPEMHAGLSVDTKPEVSAQEAHRIRETAANKFLSSRLDFGSITADSARAVMGGLFLEGAVEEGRIWASPRSAFLLRAETGAESLLLNIEVPDRTELFPGTLNVYLNGELAYSEPMIAGRSSLRIPVAGRQDALGIMEVRLEASRHFAGITDHRMKSFRIFSAEVE